MAWPLRSARFALALPLCLTTACGDDGSASDAAGTVGTTSVGGDTGTDATSSAQTSSGSSTGDGQTTAADDTTGEDTTSDTGTIPDDALVIGGDDADYPDFTSAIADWEPQTIPDGGLLFVVTAGEYPERVVVPAFDGASESNPVEFRALDGEVWITGEGSDADDDATVLMQSTDWVTFDGIGVRDDSATVEFGYHLVGTETDGVSNNTIRNAPIRLGSAAMVPARTLAVRMSSGKTMPGDAGNSNNNRFENLDIDRVGRGIQLLGPAPDDIFGTPLYDTPDTGNAIVGCTFGAVDGVGHGDDTNGYGINVFNHAGVEIADNHLVEIAITDVAPAIPAGPSAISLDGVDGLVARNRIDRAFWSGEGGSQVNGISATVTPTGTLTIANNFISGLTRGTDFVSNDGDNTLYVVGIVVFKCFGCDTVSNVANVVHNTVTMTLDAGRSYPIAAMRLSGGSGGQVDAVVRNNILSVAGLSDVGTGLAYAIVDGNTERDWLDSDGNVLWAEGPGGVLGQIGRELGGPATEAADLGEWQTISSSDANAIEAAVELVDAGVGDLHLAGSSASDASLQMEPFAGVDDDIDGDARAAMPFAGEDEP